MATQKSRRRRNGANLTDKQVWDILEMSYQGESLDTISEKYDIAVQMVFWIRHGERYEHVQHSYKQTPPNAHFSERRLQLYEYYQDTTLSLTDIAEKMGITRGTVEKTLRKYNMRDEAIDKARKKRFHGCKPIFQDREEIDAIVEAYKAGESCNSLSKRYYVNWTTIDSVLKKEGAYEQNV